MKRFLILAGLLVAGSLCLQDISTGHGGTYRGPGDTVPPGGGGGGGGGTGPTGPAGPAGPSTGGPSGPSGPATGGGPSTGGPGAGATGPTTGGVPSGPDLTTWEFWWGFNKDPYLNLKAALYEGVSSGSDGFFAEPGSTAQPKNVFKPSEQAIREKIVPALKEALEKERANDIVTGCLIALGKIGDVKNGDDGSSEFEQVIVKFLPNSSQEIAETAAVALGILANDASVKTLKELAQDSSDGRKLVKGTEVPFRTRAFAAYGLGLIGNRTAKNEVRQDIARALIDILQKPDTSDRDLKVATLTALGLVPIDLDLSGNPEAKTDHTASRQTQIHFVKRYFQDQTQKFLVRAHAPTALARLLKDAPRDLREDIAKMLITAIDQNSKEKQEVQQSCVLALGQIGDAGKDKLNSDIRSTLMAVTKNGDEQSKNFAMIALAQIGGRGKGEDFEKGRKDVRDFLLATVTSGRSHLKTWAGLSIGVMERELIDNNETPSGDSKQTLRSLLREAKQPDQVGAWAIGLGIAKDAEAKELMSKKLDDTSDQGPKGYLCIALGLLDARDKVTLKKIQDIVKESTYKPDLLKQAAIGLGLLGDKELVPELTKTLGEAKGQSSQAAIASALGFIGDSRSIDPLIAMLKKTEGISDTARAFATVALGIVADKELLPWNSKISVNINYRANTSTLTGAGTGILDIF